MNEGELKRLIAFFIEPPPNAKLLYIFLYFYHNRLILENKLVHGVYFTIFIIIPTIEEVVVFRINTQSGFLFFL